MWGNLVSVLVMGMTFLYMLNKAHFAQTRRLALVPLGFCAVDMLCAGAVAFGAFPVITAMLIALRLTVLLCCAAAMRRDAIAARRAARRRAQRAMAAQSPQVEVAPPVASSGCVVSLQAARRSRCA